ncbi:DUF805 domain-containing protein [Polymorphobacter sp.]|uniref:DUF805 domain-containing protein n=1 Tax=Polymorphobacter sp. TaxID=1909290 RepID=UPI003F7303CD
MDRSALQWALEPLRKFATFSGRARRAEYWWFSLFVMLIAIALTAVDFMLVGAERLEEYGIGPLGGLFSLALVIPGLAASIRRLHDRDKSGWWLLWGLLPVIGGLILLIQYVQRGTVGDNRFGPDPVPADH